MKTVCLIPYAPWPTDTGTRVEMMKHLDVLLELGSCTIASARHRPVGFGWTQETCEALRDRGFQLVFREDTERLNPVQVAGWAYGAVCKGLKMERAFGHSNPYHRYAFTQSWWRRVTEGADLAVMQYGFWSRLKASCPQVVALHELLSNYHLHATPREYRELVGADHVLVVGYDEKESLEKQGVPNVSWSPPAVPAAELPLSPQVGLVGTTAPQNVEGLEWLEQVRSADVRIRVYGSLAKRVQASYFEPVGRYERNTEPYEECGIHLMTRPDRPGLQIKVVEALACGRAIIARRGSMRGLPPGKAAWIDVETPEQMLKEAERLNADADAREQLAGAARDFYARHLACDRVLGELKRVYESVARQAQA